MIDPTIEGKKCPHCNQYVKLYKRKITSSMAYALILIQKYFDNNDEEWLHVTNYLSKLNIPTAVKGGDFAKLMHWKLLIKMKETRDDGSDRVGYWKVTQKGKDFIKGNVKVPKFAGIYNQKFYGFSGDLISIKDALGTKFKYDELMGGI